MKKWWLSLLMVMHSFGQAVAAEDALILYTNPLAFFSTSDEMGQPAGYSVELSKGVIQKAHMDAQIMALPWARIIKLSQQNELSLITGMVRTPEREDNYHWITPISRNPVALYTLRGNKRRPKSLDEVNQYESVAVLRDDYRQTILDNADAANVVTFNTWQQAIGSLLKERVESLFFSDMGVALMCLDSHLNCEDIHRVFVHQTAVSYLAMRKTSLSQPYADRLFKAAQEYKNSTEFLQMAASHLSQRDPMANSMVLLDGMISLEK